MTVPTSAELLTDSSSWERTFALPRPEIHLRALQEKDVRRLEWHGGPDLRQFYLKQWDAHQSGNVTVVVATLRDYPVAQAAIHWLGKPTFPLTPDVQSLRVLEALQGQGIGTKLLELCEHLVRRRKEPQITLAVALDNPRARRLYERVGFRVTGDPYHDKWSYIDAQGNTVPVDELVTDLVKDLD